MKIVITSFLNKIELPLTGTYRSEGIRMNIFLDDGSAEQVRKTCVSAMATL